MGKREKGIQSRTVKEIAKTFDGSLVRVKHGTAFAIAGDADVYGCLPQLRGRMFWFEIKNDEGKLTRIQQYRMDEAEAAHAIIGAIRHPEDAIAILSAAVALFRSSLRIR